MLRGTNSPLLQMADDIAFCHHERWDGSGYPRQIVGKAIPGSARMAGLLDVYDALEHDRVYRSAFSEARALAIMVEAKVFGQYDPTMFDVFVDLLPSLREVRHRMKDEAS